MVSALWKACSEGNLEVINEILKDAPVDLEVKDPSGITPLIEAIKNGHTEIVRILLDKGADPTAGTSEARPEQFTTDPAIFELLESARTKITSNGLPAPESAYPIDLAHPDKSFYAGPPPPPEAYPYYPTLNAPPPMPEGMYYPPPSGAPHSPSGDQSPGGIGHLPPPEIARFIPCRYYPACRYGPSCIFAHPQAPYYQGPLPLPAQYGPPYESIPQPPYAQGYYPPPPPAFHSPNGGHPMNPLSPPPPPMAHARSASEIVSPTQPPYPPNGAPYGPLPPNGYPHPPHMAPPVPPPGPVPPIHHTSVAPPNGPQSPTAMYQNTTAPFPVHADPAGQYAAQVPNPSVKYSENNAPKSPLNPSPDNHNVAHVNPRENAHHRRGNGRRTSFPGRKPPCFFFPSGRCKNGDDCRFPHVLPAEGTGPHNAALYNGRGTGPRPRNGFGSVEDKFAAMSVRDENSRPQNAGDESNYHQPHDLGNRPRYFQGTRHNQIVNGMRNDKKVAPMKQRVPNADEFPVLGGSTTPPSRSPGAGGMLLNGSGPTAAQVLQAPPPKKDGMKDARGSPAESVRSASSKELKPDLNGTSDSFSASDTPVTNGKMPLSFAKIATTAVPDASKEVSVSA